VSAASRLVLALGLCGPPGAALAGPAARPAVEFRWDAPAGCPDEVEVVAQLEALRVNGFCSAGATDESCMPMPNGEDGCAKNELCISDPDDPEAAKCYAFPACAADDTCPKGSEGAVCNTGIIPSKGHICLIGACTDAAKHCPEGDKCVKFTGEELGSCSAGALGDLCNAPADCVSGNCFIAFPGEPGFCM